MPRRFHYAAHHLSEAEASERDVFETVLDWKQRRKPPLREDQVALSVRHLNLLGWIDASFSPELVEDELPV